MLTLPIKKKWFDMIVLREKKEEYREEKSYYKKRFQNVGLLDENGITTLQEVKIALRNGYSKNDPTIIVSVVLKHGYGRKEWGAEDGVVYYALEIVKVHCLIVGGETVWQSVA